VVVKLAGAGQFASRRLPAVSQQFYLGGAAFGPRLWAAREDQAGDNGVAGRWKSVRQAVNFRLSERYSALRFSSTPARSGNHGDGWNGRRVVLASVGAGIRLTLHEKNQLQLGLAVRQGPPTMRRPTIPKSRPARPRALSVCSAYTRH